MNSLISLQDVESNQEAFLNAIIESKGAQLPATIPEIIPVLEFSKARMTAFKALSDAANKVSDQQALNNAALESGQRWGIVHLYGQKKLGELTAAIPRAKAKGIGGINPGGALPSDVPGKREMLESNGISKNNYNDAERIARNPEILESVIDKAKQSGDIPTKGRVIAEIMKKDAAERSARKHAEQITKIVKEKPKAVKEYFEALKQFKTSCIMAKEAAVQNMFAEESISIIQGKHDEIRNIMNKIEELICQK